MLLSFRRLVRLFVASIVVNFLVMLSWWMVSAFQVTSLTQSDPATKVLVDKINATVPADWSFKSDAEAEAFMTSLSPILRKLNWGAVALWSGLVFLPIGFVACRWLDDGEGGSDWTPVLPLISILAGQNPANMGNLLASKGVPEAELSLVYQVVILGEQVALVAVGAWLMERYIKSRQRNLEAANSVGEPDESTSNDESAKG